MNKRRKMGRLMFQATWFWSKPGVGVVLDFDLWLVEVFIGPLELAVWRCR